MPQENDCGFYIQHIHDEANSDPCLHFSPFSSIRLKGVSFLTESHGLPELISIGLVVALHLWKRQMLLSIAGGTVCYMLLVQFVF